MSAAIGPELDQLLRDATALGIGEPRGHKGDDQADRLGRAVPGLVALVLLSLWWRRGFLERSNLSDPP